MDTRSRMTLWQALAAGLILIIIVALLLPGLQSWRAAAMSKSCVHNLHQIGLAMHNYHESHNVFPPGITSYDVPGELYCHYVAESPACDSPTASRGSAFTSLLPFIDQPATARAYNHDLACCHISNITATSTIIKTYLCPANDRTNHRVKNAYYSSDPGSTDYALSCGANAYLICQRPFGIVCGGRNCFPNFLRPGVGSFHVNSSTSQRHFRDGMVDSFLVGEAAGGTFSIHTPRFAGPDNDSSASLDPTLTVDQAWSQGYLGNDGMGATGSVFAATALDFAYGLDKRQSSHQRSFLALPPVAMDGKRGSVRLTSFPVPSATPVLAICE